MSAANESTTIRWDQDADGVVILTLDDPNQSANTMNAAYAASIRATVDRLEAEQDSITGVIITSAKKTFFAGGDLNDLKQATPANADEIAGFVRDGKAVLRRLETLGKPVVAAINGAALGGGLEIALACHYRIVVDDPKAVVGFPEVQLGLLPGAGGVVRTVRMLGIVNALMGLLLQGQRLRPAKALEVGVVNEVVPTRDDLIPAAKKWIAANPEAQQPWDADKKYKIPGGTPSTPSLAANLPAFPANLRKQIKGANYPAPHHIMAAAVEGAQVDFDNASAIEGRYFVDLVTGQVSKNMIQAFFFDLQRATGDRGRPAEIETFAPTKVVVLGAGMMGAAIAYVCAKAGLEVVLKDVDQAAADKGKGYSAKLVAKAVERGRSSQEDGDALLDRITATTDPAAAAGAAAGHRGGVRGPQGQGRGLRRDRAASGARRAAGLQHLDAADHRAGRQRHAALGLHRPAFLQPGGQDAAAGDHPRRADLRRDAVPRAGRGQADQEDADRRQRQPRLLHQPRHRHLHQRGHRHAAGGRARADDRAGLLAGRLPGAGAPALRRAQHEAHAQDPQRRQGRRRRRSSCGWDAHPSEQVIDRMLDEFERPGRLEGAGFYEYEDGKRTRLWPGLRDAFPVEGDPSQIDLKDLEERMLVIESLETVKCLDEGVIESVADANIGSIMGIGFPGWTGGVLQYINGYDGGLAGFVARARELAERYGERFEPPASLVEKAERGEIYSDEAALVTS